jgi:hypothetical protein
MKMESRLNSEVRKFSRAGSRLYSWIKPRRVALATALVRLMTFILAKMVRQLPDALSLCLR